MLYGYIRVSAREQNLCRQQDAMAAFGVAAQNVFADRQSGKSFERPAWRQLLRRLRAKDVLAVASIDRLGRNYEEILQQWRLLADERAVDIVVLDFPLLDTRTRQRDGGLTGRFVADLVLQILAYVAQQERENLLVRQAQGIAAARGRGVRFGRPDKPLPPEFVALYDSWLDGQLSMPQLLAGCGITRSTLYRRVARYGLPAKRPRTENGSHSKRP